MTPYDSMYALLSGLLNMITNSGGFWYIIGPFIVLTTILGVIRWVWYTARGQTDAGDLQRELSTTRGRLADRGRQIRDSGRPRP